MVDNNVRSPAPRSRPPLCTRPGIHSPAKSRCSQFLRGCITDESLLRLECWWQRPWWRYCGGEIGGGGGCGGGGGGGGGCGCGCGCGGGGGAGGDCGVCWGVGGTGGGGVSRTWLNRSAKGTMARREAPSFVSIAKERE
eukprot:4231725-Pleurochrysis_carterae.AAC.2